ncbi:MAG TPA: quinolinate synthase NadA [Bacteroidia bacterium]|nr:quinolinate synthase NadA [Bacteroidia bacterium]
MNTIVLDKGWLNVKAEPGLDLVKEIRYLKEKKQAVLLAHYYQNNDIQDIADYIGDSLGLAQEAKKTQAKIILFAGVHFMAETAKILNPGKKVLIPDLHAGCSLADSCPPEAFAAFKKNHPDHIVISYINCSAETKALSDIICTSSNAVQIVQSLPPEQKIIFAPDKNLGAYINRKTNRDMLLWNGTCMVHEIFSLEKLVKLKHRHPEALVLAHPECEEQLLAEADYIGSTTALLKYSKSSEASEFIVLTEPGILHAMQKSSPHKTFIPSPPENNCACNECPHMKLNTMEKIYTALKFEEPEIEMDSILMEKARKPIMKMLDLSKQFGL